MQLVLHLGEVLVQMLVLVSVVAAGNIGGNCRPRTWPDLTDTDNMAASIFINNSTKKMHSELIVNGFKNLKKLI